MTANVGLVGQRTDGHALGVDGAQVGVLQQVDEHVFCGLKGEWSRENGLVSVGRRVRVVGYMCVSMHQHAY